MNDNINKLSNGDFEVIKESKAEDFKKRNEKRLKRRIKYLAKKINKETKKEIEFSINNGNLEYFQKERLLMIDDCVDEEIERRKSFLRSFIDDDFKVSLKK